MSCSQEMRGGMGVGCRCEAGGVRGGRVQGVQVSVEIGRDVIGRDGDSNRVLCIRADQCWVPVNGESFILIDDQRTLGAAARL